MLILPGCRSRQDAGPSDSAAVTAAVAGADTTTMARADTATMAAADTAMVPATAIGKMVGQMMESMEAHMRLMDTASVATMQARMPRHHQMADNMIARMNEEVRRMNIATDSIWPATVDSVRQDLSRLRAMPAGDMTAMMPAHLVRMRWLIQMQRTMTGKTPP
jgi:hypothetical protein